MKCIVLDCKNYKGEGVFVGDICRPCYDMITKGRMNPSYNFIYEIWLELKDAKTKLEKINKIIFKGNNIKGA